MVKGKQSHGDTLDQLTSAILRSISDGVFTIDRNWRISSFNRAAELITGVSAVDAVGRPCSDVFRSSLCGQGCALRRTLETGLPLAGVAAFIIDASGQRVPVSLSTALLIDDGNEFIGGVETFRDMSEVEELKAELVGIRASAGLSSHSERMRRVLDIVPAVASSSATVLIQGETGTGKEVLARELHSRGPRSSEPFIAVNCGALPESLLESELFGYVKGAFTGAVTSKPGRFAAAGRGTIFLDEISELSPAVQVKLLRVLQERAYEPLGTSRTSVVHARIIVATNRDIQKLVESGIFREDLYYRVNVVRIDLPPLRQRIEDIPMLVKGFIQRFNRIQNKSIQGIDSDALGILMGWRWPGNIRELENVIERAFVVSNGGLITRHQLPPDLLGKDPRAVCGESGCVDLKTARRSMDAQLILDAIERNGSSISQAAKELGVHRTTLHRRLRAIGMENRPGR